MQYSFLDTQDLTLHLSRDLIRPVSCPKDYNLLQADLLYRVHGLQKEDVLSIGTWETHSHVHILVHRIRKQTLKFQSNAVCGIQLLAMFFIPLYLDLARKCGVRGRHVIFLSLTIFQVALWLIWN